MRKGGKKMIWVLCSVAISILGVIVFFQIPYSRISNAFQKDVQRHIEQSNMQPGIFSEQDIIHLPEPVQNHFHATGIIGQPIMSYVSVNIPSSNLLQSPAKPPLSLDYSLCLFGYSPVRLAYMRTSMFGIPFEAYDSFQYGVGSMKGVIGKVFTLFNQTGYEMDKGQLLTYLAETLLIPSAIFNNHITWESIDANHAKATIIYGELSGSGIFSFDDNGFFQSFRTDERARIDADGNVDFPEWSAIITGWEKGETGMYYPNGLKAMWHLPDGDFIYFETIGSLNMMFHYY